MDLYTEMLNALRDAQPVLEALQAAHPLPTHDSAVGHGHALRLVREAIARAEVEASGSDYPVYDHADDERRFQQGAR